jgi:hypothetical protein
MCTPEYYQCSWKSIEKKPAVIIVSDFIQNKTNHEFIRDKTTALFNILRENVSCTEVVLKLIMMI